MLFVRLLGGAKSIHTGPPMKHVLGITRLHKLAKKRKQLDIVL